MKKQLHADVEIKGTNLTGRLVGKGFSDNNGTVEDRYIVRIDTSKTLLQDILPFIKEIVVDPSQIKR